MRIVLALAAAAIVGFASDTDRVTAMVTVLVVRTLSVS